MQSLLNILVISVLMFTGCASSSLTDSMPYQTEVVGTWRWVSYEGNQFESPIYIRFYKDGTSAEWPVKSEFATNGVTYRQYQLKGAVLNIDSNPDPGYLPLHIYKLIKIKGNKMTWIGEESDHYVYQRVVPDLEPGKKENY